MSRLRTLLPIAWLMALLLLPATAYLVGARQPALENREKTAFPDLNRGTLRQEHTYQQIDAAVRERLPLRQHALDLRGRIATDLFHDSPDPSVILGEDGWLYYAPELQTCTPLGAPSVSAGDALELLTRTAIATGRRPITVVTGSKVVTHPQQLRNEPHDLECVERFEAEIHERLDAMPGGLNVQPGLERAEAAGTVTFLRSDSHWNVEGRRQFAEAVLNRVRPRLGTRAGLEPAGEGQLEGDLGRFIGQQRIDHEPLLTVTGTPSEAFRPGEVLMIGDSQLDAALLSPGADGRTVHEHVLPGQPICPLAGLINGACDEPLVAAETIVFQTVARNLKLFTELCWRPTLLLASTVAGRPAQWAGSPPGAPIELGPAPVPVRVQLDDEPTDVPRLVRIPVVRLAGDPATPQRVTATPPEPLPCMSAEASVSGGEMLLPVPPGAPVRDLALELAGPPGTVLGAPEVLVLDGQPLPPRG